MARILLSLLFFAVTLVAVPSARAHVERPSYFPDPAADTSVSPAAGGTVPEIRSLASALNTKRPGRTRIVCKSDSMAILRRAIGAARRDGYLIRPTERRRLSAKQAKRLLSLNRSLRRRCRFDDIQPAVTASRNNDRVVIMPGTYEELPSRAARTNDPACDPFRTNGDKPGEEGNALSYEYQVRCPNDQNLIALVGREVGSGKDPVPPRPDRFGIPNLGKCLRCNVQIEGSGVSADDVVIDAGDTAKGNGGPNGVGSKKDVVIRADRADGFVLRNVTTRHAGENGIYVIETDGYVLDRFKSFYNKLYGTLTFASDHGVHQHCEAVGHGDSGVYPGGAPETGVQRPVGTKARMNQLVRRCDLHHNMSGYSGTNGNAVHVQDNDIYDNALGLTTDVVTAPGHPGFPGDSILFEENRIYTNNFNVYDEKSDVKPAFPFPVGTGMWIAGGNHHQIRGNHFYDNWRRGVMVFAVPDALVCGPAAGGNEQAGCNFTSLTTSHYNQIYENKMGVDPAGKALPNGVDFWWDQFLGNRGNCWYRNSGPKPITSSPATLPDCADGRDPAMSVGVGNAQNELELISCVAAFETRNFDPDSPCPWLSPPPKPSGGSAQRSSFATSRFYKPVASAQRAPRSGPIPLSQANCGDWHAASGTGRARLAERLRAFAGGVVNTGKRDVGWGPTLSAADTTALYDGWCSRAYAQDFLLYKLYTAAATFSQG